MKKNTNNFFVVAALMFILGGVFTFFLKNPFFKNSTSEAPKILSETTDKIKTPELTPTPKYYTHKNITTTVFWVGEEATSANRYIANHKSAWDGNWEKNFGGVDDPYNRDGYYPKGFIPKENPFYFALPYNDLKQSMSSKNAELAPWFEEGKPDKQSQLKNTWIKVTSKQATCYAQWQDVGPFKDDDYGYVFGKSKPAETIGLDVSPAVRDCLKIKGKDITSWQFADFLEVPDGPWKEIITVSNSSW